MVIRIMAELGLCESCWEVFKRLKLQSAANLYIGEVSQKVLGADEVSKANQLVIGTSISEESPNLICRHPTMGNIVAVKNISKPEHRLVLMGGPRGVLEQMSFYNVTPDIKTFAHLLDQIPHTLTDEQELLTAMKHLKVKIDLDFYNMLIRKRCIRGDFSSAKEVLKMIQAENFRPNIVTFGVLALTCRTLSSAQQLVQDIHNVGFRPNVEILGALLKNACYSRDCDFIMGIMKMIKEEEIQPSKMLLNHLNNFYRFATDVLSKQDTDDTGKLRRDRFEAYLKYFHSWRPEMRAEEAPHPWKQYKEYTSEPDDIELLNKGRMKNAP